MKNSGIYIFWLFLLVSLMFGGLFWQKDMAPAKWQIAYEHDTAGLGIEGSKETLIEAIRLGYPVRIYWAGGPVEHVTNVPFLTILGGEVFGQIHPIKGQKPITTPPSVELRENEWVTIFSTNGERSLKWFVYK
ncbi:hypothetical protein [Paremcibacter congregatus]|uniref:Uncharacterized protein n=1 Tax=Paremcibacter congregatus TaxID=2043170 RepID=A0A2G4YNK2_9PROT|nr:hypothetical protein [Paremcibacter congregatus]PHZ83887.1 hypothetical protein CRD36_16185 [Paremcibacter congregatus]QDE27591.1 hypothetical protein FIV45_10020 [Paremcibacter congregatus]